MNSPSSTFSRFPLFLSQQSASSPREWTRLIAVLLPCAWLWTGCGPKHGEIVDSFKPQYTEMRMELASIVPLIPKKVAPTNPPPQLDPMPEFKDKRLRSNTTIVMYENLTDPERDLYKEGKLNCCFSNNLMMHLRWTGPDDPMSDNLRNRGAEKELEARMQYPLDVRYVGVVRVLQHEPAVAVSADEFNGGAIIVGVFLYDREKKAIVAEGLTMARPDLEVNYRYTEDQDPMEALQNWANSSLKMNAAAQVLTTFAEVTGGTFSK